MCGYYKIINKLSEHNYAPYKNSIVFNLGKGNISSDENTHHPLWRYSLFLKKDDFYVCKPDRSICYLNLNMSFINQNVFHYHQFLGPIILSRLYSAVLSFLKQNEYIFFSSIHK